MSDEHPAVDRALMAVARHRAVGLHFIGHFVGIEPADGAITLLPWRGPGDDAPLTDVELGVFADLAMGQAVRDRLPDGSRIATSSLVLQHGPTPVPGRLTSSTAVQWSDDERGTATVRLEVLDSSSTVVAAGSASFSAVPAPPGRTVRPVDWSRLGSGLPVPDRHELDDVEALAASAVEAAAAAGGTVAERLVEATWEDARDGTASGEVVVGPALQNRVGHLQGGVAYGLGAAAARHLVDGHRVVDGRVQYLRPVGHGPVTVTATVLRSGRTIAFVRVGLHAEGRQRAEMTFTLAPA